MRKKDNPTLKRNQLVKVRVSHTDVRSNHAHALSPNPNPKPSLEASAGLLRRIDLANFSRNSCATTAVSSRTSITREFGGPSKLHSIYLRAST